MPDNAPPLLPDTAVALNPAITAASPTLTDNAPASAAQPAPPPAGPLVPPVGSAARAASDLPSLGSLQPNPTGPDDDTLVQEKQARQELATPLSYVMAGVRQDSMVNNMLASFVGLHMQPDPNFNVNAPAVWKSLTTGIDPAQQKAFLTARSGVEAQFIRDHILQNQEDQANLSDMGWTGQTLNQLGGFLAPENLLMIAGSVGVGGIVGAGSAITRANAALRLTAEMAEGPARTAAVTAATQAMGIASRVGGVAAGAAQGAGLETLRQHFNYEDDSTGVIKAGLMGALLAAPFVHLHANEMGRLRESASTELSVLNAMQRAKDIPTVPLDPVDTANAAKLATQQEYTARLLGGETPYADLPQPAMAADTLHPKAAVGKSFAFEADAKEGAQALTQHYGTPFDAVPHPSKDGMFTIAKNDAPAAPRAFEADAVQDAAGLSQKYGTPFEAVPHPTKDGMFIAEPAKAPVVEGMKAPEEEYAPDGQPFASVGSDAVTGSYLEHAYPAVAPTYLRSGRLDIYAALNRSENPVIQNLGHMMVKDAIGNSKDVAQGWSASERKRILQRVIGGHFHTEAQASLYDAAKVRGIKTPMLNRAFANHFYELVNKTTLKDPDVLRDNPDIAPHLQRASAAQSKAYADALDKAKTAGVKGAENVEPNDAYVNRVFNFNAIDRLRNEHGDTALSRMIANSQGATKDTMLEAANTGKTVDEVKQLHASRYLSAVRKLQFSHVSQDMALYSHDMGTLRSELTHAGLSSEQIDSMIDTLFEKRGGNEETGVQPNLKSRFRLDPNYAEVMPNGAKVKVSDLFENDSRVLVDRYINAMTGHTAMAEHGIFSRSDFTAHLRAADEWHEANGKDVSKYNSDKKLVTDMYDNVTGRPMSTHEFNITSRMSNVLRAVTRTKVLGQLGMTLASQMGKSITLSGLSAALKQMPTFRSVMRAVSTGHKFDAGLATDIRHVWGFGSEGAASHAREHELSDFMYDRGLTRWENASSYGSHMINKLSGGDYANSFGREMSSRMLIQKYADLASGRKAFTEAARTRMVGNGVDRAMQEPMLRDLDKYAEREDNRVTGIRWEDWQQEKPHTFDNFQRAVEREVREAIHEYDIGETMPFMHTTLGKVFSELRTFMMVGHAKNMLRQVHYHDAMSANLLMSSAVSEAMNYALQTSINFAGDPAELQRRMQPDVVAGSVFQRMSIFGVGAMAANTVANVFGKSIPGTSANTENRTLFMPPSFNTAQELFGAAKTLGTAVNPWSNHVATYDEIHKAFGVFPGGNLYGMRNINDWLAQGHPSVEPRGLDK